MHPAYSVILFTTISGAGFGLLMCLTLAALVHGQASNWRFALVACGAALVLIVSGLAASTFHLGRPERAWRAFSQWRSSWLSREALAALAVFPLGIGFALLWSGVIPKPSLIAPAALGALSLCIASLYCTAKIYSSLPTIRQWHHPLVDAGYFLWSFATGSVLLVVVSAAFDLDTPALGRISAFLLVCVALCKWGYWHTIDTLPRIYTIEQATGLGPLGRVRQWEAPHTTENFVMREMGYRVARKHRERLRRYVFAGLFFSAALTLAGAIAPGVFGLALAIAGLLCATAAVLIERWLFFAEAQHVSSLYYGAPNA
jgi:sulfite dehydrogenase (quinone) subunit SoeC